MRDSTISNHVNEVIIKVSELAATTEEVKELGSPPASGKS